MTQITRLESVTRPEFEMIEAIRAGAALPKFKLTVRHQRGQWLIETSSFPHSDACKSRGVGASFSAAWSAMSSLAVEPISAPPIPPR